jgi:ABC-type Zn uptake system ZnuABC Zn-binding protein ZnuA
MQKTFIIASLAIILSLALNACQVVPGSLTPSSTSSSLHIIAVESFLGDIAQNVAGDRLKIDTLIPIGVDPHVYELTPQDLRKLMDAQLIIANGAGLESWLQKAISNAGGSATIIKAADGLVSRSAPEEDPHFWLDPTKVIQYVKNIRDGLTLVDPSGKDIYARNAEAYSAQLTTLDQWIENEISVLPIENRLIVTNHENFGYFADRYSFRVIGTIIPSVSSDASPSAQQIAGLIDHIKQTGTRAIFLETGTNQQLADQIAQETGVKVVTGLYSHSLTAAGGDAPTYIDMMKFNVTLFVNALK